MFHPSEYAGKKLLTRQCYSTYIVHNIFYRWKIENFWKFVKENSSMVTLW